MIRLEYGSEVWEYNGERSNVHYPSIGKFVNPSATRGDDEGADAIAWETSHADLKATSVTLNDGRLRLAP